MKIAVPLFGSRISPRFDCSNEILVVEAENSKVIHRMTLLIDNLTSFEKIKKLRELKIDAMICGGIDVDSEQRLTSNGIILKAWLSGDAMILLNQFITDNCKSNNITGQKSKESKCTLGNRIVGFRQI